MSKTVPSADAYVEAEKMFRDFAARHSFEIEEVADSGHDFLMRLPAQPGLAFDLFLGLQNDDELNIGIGDFWSYFLFSCVEVRTEVEGLLEGIANGRCRVATYRQLGVTLKHQLEEKVDGEWRVAYRHHLSLGLSLPFVRKKVSYIYNDRQPGS